MMKQPTTTEHAGEAKAILFLLYNHASVNALRPWQLAYYRTQHRLAHDGYGDYQPDEFTIGVLRGIRDEHCPEREVETI